MLYSKGCLDDLDIACCFLFIILHMEEITTVKTTSLSSALYKIDKVVKVKQTNKHPASGGKRNFISGIK